MARYRDTTAANNARLLHPIVNGMKKCRTCLDIYPVSDFPYINKTKKYIRPECKKCFSKRCYRRQLERKKEKHPNSYWECEDNDCNWINSVTKSTCFNCRKERYFNGRACC